MTTNIAIEDSVKVLAICFTMLGLVVNGVITFADSIPYFLAGIICAIIGINENGRK